MSNKKKSTAENLIKETASAEPELKEQETAPTEDEPATESEQETPTADKSKRAEPLTNETPCPFEATVTVALAVLRKNIGPGTAEMLKPVATLKQGAKVIVTAIHNGNARLANGLWIALEYIMK